MSLQVCAFVHRPSQPIIRRLLLAIRTNIPGYVPLVEHQCPIHLRRLDLRIRQINNVRQCTTFTYIVDLSDLFSVFIDRAGLYSIQACYFAEQLN